jgi:phosphoenolpyruvate synthase/pyruvate phosphate dikinase
VVSRMVLVVPTGHHVGLTATSLGSIHFFHHEGLDYVSCSPFRVPVARLEAGRAALDVR